MNKLLTTTTGSYPASDLDEREFDLHASIHRVVQDQLEAGIDLLVDGQVRSDIATLFAPVLHQDTETESLPHRIKTKITAEAVNSQSLIDDFTYARKVAEELAKQYGRLSPILFKAHISGPVFLAESCRLEADAPYKKPRELRKQPYNVDPELIMDIATALGKVARDYVDAGAHIIQIDEPSLAYGADLKIDIALAALEKLVNFAPDVDWILHTCGDIRREFPKLLVRAPKPIRVLFIESDYLTDTYAPNTTQPIGADDFQRYDKKLLYGCIPVNTDVLPGAHRLAGRLAEAVRRYGIDNFYGVSPDCGLRLSSLEKARKTINLLTAAARQAVA